MTAGPAEALGFTTARELFRRLITLSPASRYTVAVGAAIAAVGVRLAYNDAWETGLPFITMLPAVILSGWLGGFWPGMRKRAETALRPRAEELERVLDMIPAAVWIATDPECREVFANRAAAALLALPQQANISQTPAAGAQEPPRMRHLRNGRELLPGELPMQVAAATGLPQTIDEIDIELPDGRRLTLVGGAIPLLDEGGRVRGVVSAFSDITCRKEIERHRAEVLMREQAARADLERAAQLKDEFMAVLSHELRTPLNAVLGYAHLLAAGTLSAERTSHALAAVQRNARAQARLVESLLDLSRVMAGKLELHLERVNLTAIVDGAVDVIRPEAEEKEITLIVRPSPDPIVLVGDADRLQQVFWNILSNAVKFTPAGGTIDVSARVRDDNVQVRVTDNGHGISSDFLPYVFDRFKQADGHNGRRSTGLGLGLALAREMVHGHGGTVDAESEGDGHGSSFTVTLPLSLVPGDTLAGLSAAQHDIPKPIDPDLLARAIAKDTTVEHA